jgi:hypothetical protein
MKTYRKPSGAYIELHDSTPVSETLVEVSPRPSQSHVFSDNWDSDPMNPSVCWRLKTSQEQDAEKSAQVDAILEVAPALRAMVDVIYPYLTGAPTKAQVFTAIKARVKDLL